MNSNKRRQKILRTLSEKSKPITGKVLADMMDVSRQVIVSDIALLRARGNDILATPQGYIMAENMKAGKVKTTIACRHTGDDIKKELFTIVNYGGKIIDVTVEHPIYGEIKGLLMIKSPNDVKQFLAKLNETNAKPLLSLTGGVHLHTIEADSEELLEKIKEELKKQNILFEE